MENGFDENFNGKLRYECLNTEMCFALAEARKVGKVAGYYNQSRAPSARGGLAPAEYLRRVRSKQITGSADSEKLYSEWSKK